MKTTLSLIALVTLFSSCVTTNYITIDTRKPALITLPPDAANVLIVDNVPTIKENSTENNDRNVDVISVDSAKEILIGSLARFMDEEKYFESIQVYPYNTGIEGYYDSDIPLDQDMVIDICEKTNTDLLISLDVLSLAAEIGAENTFYGVPMNTLEVKIGSIMRVYSKDGERLVPPLLYRDSLYWRDAIEWDGRMYNIPEVNEAVKLIALSTADMLVNKFIPAWHTEERWYYSNNSSDMQKAASLVKEGKWEDAANIWGMLYEKEQKTNKKIRLASNIALANENLDDIPDAMKWINKAYDMLMNKNESDLALQVIRYKTILQEREANMAKLQEQLGISPPASTEPSEK